MIHLMPALFIYFLGFWLGGGGGGGIIMPVFTASLVCYHGKVTLLMVYVWWFKVLDDSNPTMRLISHVLRWLHGLVDYFIDTRWLR